MSIFGNNIIKTAMLGTNTKKVEARLFAEDVQAHLNLEKEGSELFLDGVSLTHSYMTGGGLLTTVPGISDTIQQCPDEVLPYCSSRVSNVVKLILKENKYALSTFLPLVIQFCNERQIILPPAFITKFNPLISTTKAPLRKNRAEVIQSFGERGKWIFTLKDNAIETLQKSILDMSKAERKAHFLKLVRAENNQETIAFLEEVFDAETVANKKNYLSTLAPYLSMKEESVLDFMQGVIDNSTAKNEAQLYLEGYVKLLQMSLPESESFAQWYENVFSKIWKRKKGLLAKFSGVGIKTDEALDEIFSEMESFPVNDYLFALWQGKFAEQPTGFYDELTKGSVTEYLFFSFVIVPADIWCGQFKISKQKLVKLIHSIKVKMETKNKKASFVDALVMNAMRHQDVELAKELYKLLGFGGAGFNFLTLLPKEEAFRILTQNSNSLKNAGINIMDFVIERLNVKEKWNKDFTKVAIQSCLDRYVNNRHQLRLALWKGAPYFHEDAILFVPALVDESNHSRNLLDDFDEIFGIKSAFEKIKN